MSKQTLGGDRLGVEGKITVDTRTYERSSHNPSQKWISSMSPGTLVPCYSELRLPGDSSEIKITAGIMTHPTIGPLFDSFKFEIDMFQIPIRLYNPKLQLDEVNLGMNISEVKLPQIEVMGDYFDPVNNTKQINDSSILAYMDIRGIGHATAEPTSGMRIYRKFQMLKLAMYWDTYKLYYANKQEKVGAVIHNNLQANNYNTTDPADITTEVTVSGGTHELNWSSQVDPDAFAFAVYPTTKLLMTFPAPTTGTFKINPQTIYMQWNNQMIKAVELFDNYEILQATRQIVFTNLSLHYQTPFVVKMQTYWVDNEPTSLLETEPQIKTFPLENIDKLRKQMMRAVDEPDNFVIDHTWAAGSDRLEPYALLFTSLYNTETEKSVYSIQSSQEGLGLKTYLSDVNNNWLDTEWLDGDNGINAITAIEVDADGKFTLDQFNLQSKLYKMFNAVAMGDGSLRSWQLANYDHEGVRLVNSPMYLGSLIKEMAFQEVTSTAGNETQPLGTIAGRGRFTEKHKGGHIKVRIDEFSYVMGIVSLTPRITYSQGNKWDNLIENYEQFHTPALDQIGFQDLITDTLDWRDTGVHGIDKTVTYHTAGKQPAWINYTTNVNKAYGSFAEETNEMFMTLNRRYQVDQVGTTTLFKISDLTTYVDPAKYNYFFAYAKIDAQNFWVQINFEETLRRKMSARMIPQV